MRKKRKKELPLSDEEQALICRYREMKYPPVYKTDPTDRILFAERVDFDVCPYLLGKERLTPAQCRDIMEEYARYLAQTDPAEFDEYAKTHYDLMVSVMDLFHKYGDAGNKS